MKWTSRLTIMMALAGFVLAVPALAQDKPVSSDDAALQAELAALRKEVAEMRADMRKILAELQQIKRSQTAQRRPQQRKRPALDLLGKNAPQASFKTFRDDDMNIGGKSDNVKVVMFYASWCGFCKRALPGFEKLHKDYSDKDVDVIAINLDGPSGPRGKTEAQIIDHYNSLNLSLPMALDPSKKIGSQYKVSSFPTSFVLGKDGVVEAVHIGGPVGLDKTIAGEVDQLLAGKSLVKDKAAKPAS